MRHWCQFLWLVYPYRIYLYSVWEWSQKGLRLLLLLLRGMESSGQQRFVCGGKESAGAIGWNAISAACLTRACCAWACTVSYSVVAPEYRYTDSHWWNGALDGPNVRLILGSDCRWVRSLPVHSTWFKVAVKFRGL